jgi:serine/threonine protein kinase
LCHSGFEASLSRENYALNCVVCGVAFSAQAYLTKADFGANEPAEAPRSVEANPSLDSSTGSDFSPAVTNTGGLPFMHDSGVEKSVLKNHKPTETSLPVLPKREEVAPVEAEMANATSEEAPASERQIFDEEKPADSEQREALQEASPEPLSISSAPVSKPSAQTSLPKKKHSRRPLLEGNFGDYEIEGEIARGGVGAVFRARESATGRQVALKVLLDGEEAGEAERERFQHECETAKALSLPGMVQVYAVGEIEQKPFMAMELVSGRSLDKVIPEKSLSVNDCLVLMKSVAETIGALHEAGYVHRDLKPGNILIDAFGSPKVADFGLVKSLDEVTRMTASGLVCGTPAYMAPEQARGDGKAVDPRSDVWALGAVLYEMLAAQPPFQAENALRLMLKITKEQPKLPRALNVKVPADVQYIVMKCLEKNPEKRYANARALAADIGRFLQGEPLEIKPEPRWQKLRALLAAHRRRLITVGGGVAALLVVAVLARLLLAPKDPVPLLNGALRTMSQGQFEAAEGQFRVVLTIAPKNARAHLGLGKSLALQAIPKQDQQKLAAAMAETNTACQLDPTLKAEAHAQVAYFDMLLKASKPEVDEMEQAVELAQDNLNYRERLGMAYWRYGAESKAPVYFKKAVNEFQTILKADPAYPKVRDYIKQLQECFLSEQAGGRTPGPVAVHNRK